MDGKHTYASVVGAIMYAMLGTRPDLAFAIGLLTRFNSNPGKSHVGALKRVLRYLKGSIDFQLTCGAESSGSSGSMLAVLGHCDSDWGASVDDRRSVSGTVFTIAGGAVTWQAQRQKSVALSTVEAEYMAACQAAKDAVWLRALLVGLGLNASAPTSIHCDSQGAIALAKNPEHHQRSKHIDMRYHFVREQVTGGSHYAGLHLHLGHGGGPAHQAAEQRHAQPLHPRYGPTLVGSHAILYTRASEWECCDISVPTARVCEILDWRTREKEGVARVVL